MMPSRGLRLARGHAPRLRVQSRNLSSTSRIIPHTRPQPTSSLLRSRQWTTASGIAIPSIAATRHASTTPSPPPAQTGTATTPPPIATETEAPFPPDISTITLDDIDLSAYDISQIPEKIGYLHEIGLNWWYGPTSTLEYILEHIHIYSGMPWWGSMAATAVLVRCVLFPFYLRSSDSMARQAALVSITKPIQDLMTQAQRNKDTQAMQMHWLQLAAVRKRAGIKLTSQFAPMILQGILGFCGFKLIRAMAALPVPAFRDGGFLWLTDLTVPDPYGILPICMAGAIHLLVRLGGESGAAPAGAMPPGMQNFMLYGMPGIVMLIMAWQPGALVWWFTVNGALGMVQALALQRAAVRRFFGLAPLYKPPKSEEAAASPFAALMDLAMPPKKKVEGVVDIGSGDGNGGGAGGVGMQWQAPNINTNGSGPAGPVLDVKGRSTAASIAAGPSERKSGGVFSQLRERARDSARSKQVETEKKAKRRAAEAYEQRAKERDARR
ncbi:hypothetical protein LTR56_001578 [Elasticomyces elasticus]|nr:hypothetical protein LTR56_001578 [Elasticomyces elasticus]KAK3667370.1 hypothetical protein LTR22_001886 [Elasticomyces elasticus]KAK4932550.1 hypothetical protein LTR49_000974 [Elasticomyces elasticus]KAK5769572.1 hypothetical protein LTS12_000022 [Elasticomyces elasticus]